MPQRTRLAALAAIALLLTSCTADAGEPKSERTADPETRLTLGTPQAFLDRVPLASCGEFELGMEEQVPAAAMKCLEDAIGAGGAELIVTALTVEGDPTTTWFRALPTGGMETWSDVRQDKFAEEDSWHYSLCPHAVSTLHANGECTYERFE